MPNEQDSRQVARAALLVALTNSREEEESTKDALYQEGVISAAVDFGGEFSKSIKRIIECAIVAAKRENVIENKHLEEGAVSGAAHEALMQVFNKASGFSVGGKIAVARKEEHVAVSIFFLVGLGHLNEVCVGLGHRAI